MWVWNVAFGSEGEGEGESGDDAEEVRVERAREAEFRSVEIWVSMLESWEMRSSGVNWAGGVVGDMLACDALERVGGSIGCIAPVVAR